MANGKFITLEGGEGAGKSTQTKLLAQALEGSGIGVLLTREPGGTLAAEEIRNFLVNGPIDRWTPASEALLLFAARLEHMENTIRPALNSDRWVVCDRFADSTMAYQGYGHRLGVDWIANLHRLTLGDFSPDLTIILDIPPEAGLARAGQRSDSEDRYERMDPAFHQRLRDGFLEIAKRDPKRCAVVDATQDVNKVHDWIRTLIHRRLGVAVE